MAILCQVAELLLTRYSRLGTPRFASIWAETPRSLPLLPESMTWGHPSPALSRPDPDMEGGNFTYQNMEFGNEHLAALTATGTSFSVRNFPLDGKREVCDHFGLNCLRY